MTPSGSGSPSERRVVYYESMKRKLKIKPIYMSVGVMEDYKLRDLRASHTLGCDWVEVQVYLQ
jgi:hypothetical protein